MSIHSAKGLEFDVVFVIGLEEEIFPISSGEELQEERRLGYVAFTRAKRKLYLCSVESRFVHGKRRFLRPSRFLAESGVRESSTLKAHSLGDSQDKDEAISVNDMVMHKVFGTGRVCEVRNNGGQIDRKSVGRERVF